MSSDLFVPADSPSSSPNGNAAPYSVSELAGSLAELSALGDSMIGQLEQHRGQRLTDLAHHMIEIIDRNLYERSCDVRWWATDAALVVLQDGFLAATRSASSPTPG